MAPSPSAAAISRVAHAKLGHRRRHQREGLTSFDRSDGTRRAAVLGTSERDVPSRLELAVRAFAGHQDDRLDAECHAVGRP